MGLMDFFKKKSKEIVVLAPTDGEVIPTSKVEDDVFAQDMMGKGVALIPSDGKFTAPLAGKMVTVFPAKHAYGIETKEGVSILLHIGIDTVKLNGEGFKSAVQLGDKVSAGDELVVVDLKHLKDKKLSTQTPLIVTNESLGTGKVEILVSSGHVTRGTPLFKIVL